MNNDKQIQNRKAGFIEAKINTQEVTNRTDNISNITIETAKAKIRMYSQSKIVLYQYHNLSLHQS